ncbi:MAG: HesB/IscA family protein [Alphaproteobacteria bacterium]
MAGEILNITDRAVERVGKLLGSRPDAAGIRIWIKETGCSGLSYQVDFVDEAKPGDDAIETAGGTLFIDPMAVMYILGSEMDYQEDKFFSGFQFTNPNETSRCGCGESFSVGGASDGDVLKDPVAAG